MSEQTAYQDGFSDGYDKCVVKMTEEKQDAYDRGYNDGYNAASRLQWVWHGPGSGQRNWDGSPIVTCSTGVTND